MSQKIFVRILAHIKKYRVVYTFVMACVITIARRPDIVTNAQPWAEDGTMWIAQMYNQGISSFFAAQNGYYQTVSRVGAFLGLSVSLMWTPLIMNVFFIVIKSALVAILWSQRFSLVLPSTTSKFFVSGVILFAPILEEVHGNVTNIHWYLGLYALLIFFLHVPTTLFARVHDVLIITLAGLSGPFVLFWLPCAVLLWFRNVRKLRHWATVLLSVGVVCLAIQLQPIMTMNDIDRLDIERGASTERFVQIISAKLIGPMLLGENHIQTIWHAPYLSYPLFMIFLLIIFYTLIYGTVYHRTLLLYAGLQLFGTLYSPMISEVAPDGQWALMVDTITASRYFVVPMIVAGFLFAFVYSNTRSRFLCVFSMISWVLIIIVWFEDFRISPHSDLDWSGHVETFDQIETGTSYSIPINPRGWEIDLIKH